jgi:hypothetical protein
MEIVDYPAAVVLMGQIPRKASPMIVMMLWWCKENRNGRFLAIWRS